MKRLYILLIVSSLLITAIYNIIVADTSLSKEKVNLEETQKWLKNLNLNYTIEQLKSLKNISLFYSKVADITPIKNLTNLQELDLGLNDKLFDITPLQNLKNLQKLNLSGSYKLVDISPLRNLTKLQVLQFRGTKRLVNISPLQNLTKLEELDLCNTKVRDITPLSHLTNLQIVRLCNTKITDITPLQNLTKLKELDLKYTKLVNITPIKNLINLKKLVLFKTKILDISPLENLTKLQELSLRRTKVANINPIKNLVNLQNLDLYRSNVSDITALRNLSKLAKIDLSYTKVNDINTLKYLTNLRRLNLKGTKISDINPLKNLTNLQVLEVENTSVSQENLESFKKSSPNCYVIFNYDVTDDTLNKEINEFYQKNQKYFKEIKNLYNLLATFSPSGKKYVSLLQQNKKKYIAIFDTETEKEIIKYPFPIEMSNTKHCHVGYFIFSKDENKIAYSVNCYYREKQDKESYIYINDKLINKQKIYYRGKKEFTKSGDLVYIQQSINGDSIYINDKRASPYFKERIQSFVMLEDKKQFVITEYGNISIGGVGRIVNLVDFYGENKKILVKLVNGNDKIDDLIAGYDKNNKLNILYVQSSIDDSRVIYYPKAEALYLNNEKITNLYAGIKIASIIDWKSMRFPYILLDFEKKTALETISFWVNEKKVSDDLINFVGTDADPDTAEGDVYLDTAIYFSDVIKLLPDSSIYYYINKRERDDKVNFNIYKNKKLLYSIPAWIHVLSVPVISEDESHIKFCFADNHNKIYRKYYCANIPL